MVDYFQLLMVVGILYPIHLLNIQMINSLGHSKLTFRISMKKWAEDIKFDRDVSIWNYLHHLRRSFFVFCCLVHKWILY